MTFCTGLLGSLRLPCGIVVYVLKSLQMVWTFNSNTFLDCPLCLDGVDDGGTHPRNFRSILPSQTLQSAEPRFSFVPCFIVASAPTVAFAAPAARLLICLVTHKPRLAALCILLLQQRWVANKANFFYNLIITLLCISFSFSAVWYEAIMPNNEVRNQRSFITPVWNYPRGVVIKRNRNAILHGT